MTKPICNEPARIMGGRTLAAAVILMAFTLAGCGKSGNSNSTSSNPPAAQSGGETAKSGMTPPHPGMASGAMPMHKMMQNGGGMSSNTAAANGSTSSEAAAPATAASPADASASQSRPKLSGDQVYQYVCAFCHKSGLNGAPKYGDQMAWSKRVAQGKQTVYDRALHGYRGMPAKGGHPELSDAEVDAAVDYMINGSGGWEASQ